MGAKQGVKLMTSNAVSVDAFGLTDQGKKRDNNQDQFLVAELSKSMLIHQTSLPTKDHQRMVGGPQGKLFVVADGMGGHQGGDVASAVAVGSIINYVLDIMPWFYRLDESHEDDLIDEMKSALETCQQNVNRAAQNDTSRFQMGTTLTMAYVLWPRLYVVHAGDSRCYLFRGPDLEQITRDHTIAQQMVDRDVVSAEKSEQARWSHVLWNAVGGGSEEISPEVYQAELQTGDTLLLCSDGLTRHVDDERIANHLMVQQSNVQEAARHLVGLANQEGGEDNITVVVARFS
jgi:serine/threonine protein phosphatase PrpC